MSKSGVIMVRGQTPNAGVVLYTAPTPRQRQARRRSAVLALILSVAFAGGLLGHFSTAHDTRAVPTGPFSYFPN